MTMRYCGKCILPNTRPNLEIDCSGNCNCAYSNKKSQTDWEIRALNFEKIVNQVKNSKSPYDCVIPVSGGKDSTWQVIKALEFGMKPLCVTWRSPARNVIGQRNLDNLISLGVDHIDVTVNPRVERLFVLRSFERFGSPVIPMHMAIHSIPMKTALEKKIPLILWGENSAAEYGGRDDDKGFEINREWLNRYGVTFGTTAKDWISDELTVGDLAIYDWPEEQLLKQVAVRGVFLGQFFKWDPRETASIAKQNGFKAASNPVVGLFEFADVDDAFFMAIHHWLKWYKFGITRSWDNLSLDIKMGRISRSQALEKIIEIGDETPHEAIDNFCEYARISVARFFEIAEKFRNTEIWKKKNGRWVIDNFIISNYDWGCHDYQ